LDDFVGEVMSYLSHKDIMRILPELDIYTSIPDQPFKEAQVKVCSIDIRCDRVFWEQRKLAGSIDLGAAILMETSPRRHWRKRELDLTHPIKLRPGQMILGRTYERFRIPPEYAGKITGRSSYARLGIETSCTCDIINPGWEGHVPLEIINNSSNSILLYPLTPLAQIFLIPLSSKPDEDYSDRVKFESKYMNDDGGPSYWWRDAMIKQLYQSYLSKRIDQAAINKLKKNLDKLDDEGIFRLEKFIRVQKLGEITNVDDLISGFISAEKKAKRRYQAMSWIRRLFVAVLLPTSLGSIYFTNSFNALHWSLFAMTLMLGMYGLLWWWRNHGDEPRFLTVAE
jgi:deoxycytidine triphosphate deaminase